MQRGHNGRIEEAFAKAKERGEAAFVTFVTAGFPDKDGEFVCLTHKLNNYYMCILDDVCFVAH